jgi:molybdopterin biosynthesis enzyme MoaB
MRLREQQSVVKVPGNPGATTRTTREWVCPECDYFEEADEESTR